MFLNQHHRPILRPRPDWFKRLDIHCNGKRKPGHWSVRTKFVGFTPAIRFNLKVPLQLGAIYVCPACQARELPGFWK